MEDKIEHKIGTIVLLEDSEKIQLEVAEANGKCHCDGCAFVTCSQLCHVVVCHADSRHDGKNVIYKKLLHE